MNGRRDADAASPLEIWDTFFVPDFHSTDRIFDPWNYSNYCETREDFSKFREEREVLFFFVNTFVSNFEFDFFLFEI